MFSKYFSTLKIEELLSINMTDCKRVNEFFSGSTLPLSDIAKLTTAHQDPFIRKSVIEMAKKVRSSIWHNSLFIIPPLYISNGDKKSGGCLDHCLYCPWHNGNVPNEKITRLSASEVSDEVKLLLSMGYGDVELVSATDPFLLDSKKAAIYVAAAKNAGAKNVGINFFPLKSANDYSELAKAGCIFQ